MNGNLKCTVGSHDNTNKTLAACRTKGEQLGGHAFLAMDKASGELMAVKLLDFSEALEEAARAATPGGDAADVRALTLGRKARAEIISRYLLRDLREAGSLNAFST